ncbi:ribosome biogenesis protein Mak21p [[Candida] jaroonii]|uniref:Ribosome biogenesis protein Mak21p n=1 Tax=[Candida] jaroonii TaxID=467808 RepID=A0ACA9YAL8_9ASCO|nr:ribosome biogenesis protein Mak21p [[Candida] jaroonii]
MDTRINLSSLKDKIASKLGSSTKGKPGKKNSSKQKDSKKIVEKVESKKSKPATTEDETEDDILRREALSLGATEEDIALLNGVDEGEDSEQEFNGNEDNDDIKDDLKAFIKGIGLKGEVEIVEDIPELVEGDEEEVEEEDVEEAEEEEEEEVEEEEEDDVEKEQEQEQAKEKEIDTKSESSESESESESSDSSDSESEPEVEMEEQKPEPIPQPVDDGKITDFSAVDNSKLKIPGRLDWYNTPLSSFEPQRLDKFGIDRLLERAQKAINTDNETYLKEFTSNNSQKKFLSQILKDGTLNDKISALTLLIQESPLHNIKAMDTLLNFCEKKSRTAALQAINAYKDLLVNGLLPDRKLLPFNKRPLSTTLSDTHLAIYYFEDYVKKSYFKLIEILGHLCHDPIVHVKMNILTHIFDLLKAKPEQEANLLRLGVDKLGDVENKVAGKTSFQILQLEQAHPAMKKIICNSIIDIVFKTNVEHNAQYYGVLTLNQTILTRKDDELANILINTYFSLFSKILIESDPKTKEAETGDKILGKSDKGRKNNRKNFKKGKKGGKSVKQTVKTESELIEEKNSKLFSALLTGLNRAFPFSTLSNETYDKHLNTLFRITHSSNFNTSVQALVLINHIITKQNLNADRYYRALYESLLDERLLNSSKQGIYLNLLFKSLKNDPSNERVLAFVKRILQICNHWLNVGTITGMLFLLQELSKDRPQIQDLMIDMNSRPDKEGETGEVKEVETQETKETEEYDSRKRDPKFANADKSSLWEINQFLNHYHPTISIYAQSLLDGESQAKPDLGLYTLSHFLDRFVYKNSKQKAVTKGSSIMQPLGGAHTGSLLVKATNVLNHDVPVNTENWLNKKSQDIKPDEQFFHQYFTTKVTKVKGKKAIKDEDGDKSDLEDDEVWSALVKSRPDVEADSDEESIGFDEEDFSDLDDEELNQDDEDDEDEPELPDSGEENIQEDINDSDDIEQNEEFGDSDGEAFINNEDEFDSEEFELPEIESEDEEPQQESKKRKADDTKSKNKKQKVKDLPVFASADDYSKYLDSDDEDYS